MYSPEYIITVYAKKLRLKKHLNNSFLLSEAFFIYDSRLKAKRHLKNTNKRKLLYKETNQTETLHFVSELNSFYRAIFLFQSEKGFDNVKYKSLGI